ncbi:hypothetical protein [Cellulomonas rhizosphaerae]|uniref:Bacterial Ig-like domain-containing protein n=1 Tax=Cellulomonas rhizosphaerae TaxID=2293719 RepID=A0A413RI56_9CELL|nr:hypothetical protein [Cellulomonas rhizosphaerae]RHA37911.1 hypothetical protein D1825_15945 [Cellulomonas rhizosphaerae]
MPRIRRISRATAISALVALFAAGAVAPAGADEASTDAITYQVAIPNDASHITSRVVDANGDWWGSSTMRTVDGVAQFVTSWPRTGPVGDPVVKIEVDGSDFVGGYVAGDALVATRAQAAAVQAPADLGTFELRPAATISGHVTGSNGDFWRLSMQAGATGAEGSRSGPVDEDGAFTIRGLDPDLSYPLQVMAYTGSSYVGGWITSQGTTSDLDADAAPVQAGTTLDVALDAVAKIEGTLRYADRPLVSGDTRWAVVASAIHGERRQVAYNRIDGSYSIDGLRAGASYTVCVSGGMGIDAGCLGQVDAHVVPTGAAVPVTAPATDADAVVWESLYRTGAKPTIERTPAVGDVLTLAAPTWSEDDVTVTYSWHSGEDLARGTVTTNAAGSTYRVSPDDVGKYVWVVVTASAPNRLDGTYGSETWAPVSLGAAPAVTAAITGSARVGSRLDAKVTGGQSGTTTSYVWTSNGRIIGRGSSLTLGPGEVDTYVQLVVRSVLAGHETAEATDSVWVTPGAAPRALVAPRLTGAVRVGSTLKVDPGTWNSPGVRFTYTWTQGTITSSDNRSASYKLSLSDTSKRIRAHVVVSRPGYESTTFDLVTGLVPRIRPTVSATLVDRSVRTSSRAKVVVKVTGQVGPRGTVKVRYGSKAVSVKMVPTSKNRVTVVLPKLKRGTYKVSATFTPTGSSASCLTPASSSTSTLTVR